MMEVPFEWGDNLPELPGRKIHLRPMSHDDAADVLAVFGDPEVVRYWSSAPLPDLAAARVLISDIEAAFSRRNLFQWAIALGEAGQLVGTCTLYNVDRAHRRAEIGFALRRDSWGQGFAADALTTLIGFCFERLGLHRLEADADPRNERSLRTLERQGFRREGHLRERWHHLGEVHDGIFLGLLRREWSGRSAGAPGVPAGIASRPIAPTLIQMLTIRTAVKTDAVTIWDAERRTALTPGLLASRPGEIPVEIFEQKIEAMMAHGRYVVAELAGTTVGHALLEPLGSLVATSHVFVLTIVVHPGMVGQGIGSALLADLLDWAARDARVVKVELRVRSTNTRAIALYEKFGFVEEGRFRRRLRLDDGRFIDDLSMACFPGAQK